jgi:hypothetical protein
MLETRALLSASRLVVNVPAWATAGDLVNVTVTAVDEAGQRATDYAGVVQLGSSDGSAVLPGNYTFTAADQGRHVFQVRLQTAGTPNVLAQDTAQGTVNGSASLTLVPAAADHFSVSVVPSAAAGDQLVVTVAALDQFGNQASGYAGTVHLASSDGTADLPADYTFTVSDLGSHVFQVALKTVGEHELTVADTADAELAGSASVEVIAAGVHHFDVVTTTGAVGAGGTVAATVTARDAYGNLIDDYTGTVRFGSSDDQAKSADDYTFTEEDDGSVNVVYTMYTAGTQQVKAWAVEEGDESDCGCTSEVKGSADVVVTPGPAIRFDLVADERVVAGTEQEVIVLAQDAYGNVATNFTGTVTFTSSDPSAALPADLTFTAQHAGAAQVGVTFGTYGDHTLTAGNPLGVVWGSAEVGVRYATANQNYVHRVYEELLGRPADQPGLAFWSGRLDQGFTRTAVVTSIQRSFEYRALYVNGLYEALLGRPADEPGLLFFVGMMGNGAPLDQVSATLIASAEYKENRGAGLDVGFLEAMYVDLLDRGLDPGARAYYSEQLSGGASRGDVVRQVMDSAEARQAVVQDVFQHLLGRTADPAAMNFFVAAQQQHGLRAEGLMNIVLSSNEYYNRVSN